MRGSSLFCLVLLAVRLFAQPASLIKLDVVVTDESGNPVSGLRSIDLTLLDNGQPQKILSFQDGTTAKPDPPVEVILVIDTVNLTQEQVAAAKSSVEKLLRANEGHLAQPVQLFLLSPKLLSSTRAASTDGNTLADQIARGTDLPVARPTMVLRPGQTYRVINGKAETTAEGEANRISLNALGAIAIEERRKPGRKLLFWIGPGWPINQGGCDISFDSVRELSTRLREARITLWTANEWPYREPGYLYHDLLLEPAKTANDVQSGHLSLVVLATQSGGGMLNTAGDLSTRISEQVQQANAFYTLAFDPPPTQNDDEYHDLKIAVAGSDRTARTSTAYYNEPSYRDQPSRAQHVTVAQLEQMLQKARGDKEAAETLSAVELTERMSSATLGSLSARLPGRRSRAALVAVADRSVFLPLPPSEIPGKTQLGWVEQQRTLAKTLEYLNKTMLKLPDFSATRTTIQYDEPERKDPQLWKTVAMDQSLHLTKTFNTTIVFRDGKEVTDADPELAWLTPQIEPERHRKLGVQGRLLDTQGTFGPILAMAFAGAANSKSQFVFSHWEQGTDTTLAVFRYAVPLNVADFQVGFCCLADPDGTIVFRSKTGYHGEMAINPANGAILRLTVLSDLEPRLPLQFTNIMVEYGSVAIGGKTHILPTRSVSISRQRTVTILDEWGEKFGVYGRFETILNDVVFGQYHLFGSESRMLPGYTPVPQ
ncbi:MAG TPA: VWA domain-containing protein [Acidobacteriaceae bacterium]|nr:VWA domain-containing protein [Acidobacteriaceae bacterium]